MPSPPPSPLDRVVSKYRRDVHRRGPPAAPGAVTGLEEHLGHRLPTGLRTFLSQHNGAFLFRGALRIRSTSEIVAASPEVRAVVLFADGFFGDVAVSWAYARRPEGGIALGRWLGNDLVSEYATFAAWLASEIAVLDSHDVDANVVRARAAPRDPFQLVRTGLAALIGDDRGTAREVLTAAVGLDPDHLEAWQALGDARWPLDPAAAHAAWLEALRRIRLPLAWPGAPCPTPALIASLAPTFLSAMVWEGRLKDLLTERVEDVASPRGGEFVQAVGLALVRSLVARGQRRLGWNEAFALLDRFDTFRWSEPWDLLLEAVGLGIDLGHHDAAEALLGRLQARGSVDRRGIGRLRLAEIAVARLEPWAEDVLDDASRTDLSGMDGLHLALLTLEARLRSGSDGDTDPMALVARAEGTALAAYADLVAGDAARSRGQRSLALDLYHRGRCAGEGREVAHRIHLRLSDLSLQDGNLAEAAEWATAAARGFRQLQYPVREAWALLRLARLADADPRRRRALCAAARERFEAADLAAGIAAVDEVEDRPGGSLSWHLARAAVHTRARRDAQRARPPRIPGDADRPERRLGGHRLAIARGSDAVVVALAGELDATARVARGRSMDPAILRYVTAVDLLSGHPSTAAAEVLLEHLMDPEIGGPQWRAVQGAIARSPNAAVVDGLLCCVTSPVGRSNGAVAAAVSVLGMRRTRGAVAPLVRLLRGARTPRLGRAVLVALGRIGDRQVTDAVLPALDDPRLAEPAALALLMLGDRRGVDFHGRALITDRADLSGSPGEIVGRYGGPDHLPLLMRSVDGGGEGALGAMLGLGLMGDPRGVPTLIEALQGGGPRCADVAAGALQILTGHEEIGGPGIRARWRAWWTAQGPRFPAGVRHRHGTVFSAGDLVQRMGHPDAYVRRTAYDELVITSGEPLPFDADGPWRVQQSHRDAWRRWWRTRPLEAGRWYLDGARIH